MVQKIGKEEFDKADELPEPPKPIDFNSGKEISDQEFNNLLGLMQNPVEAQKQLAVQIKSFLDHRIENEMREKGVLSDHTRRWVDSYNTILEKIQKALYGDKNVNLHLHKVSHSHIAAKIRESQVIDIDSDS